MKRFQKVPAGLTLLSVTLAIGLCSSGANAQARGRRTLSTPGSLSGVGQSGSSYSFKYYSSGGGGGSRMTPGGGNASALSPSGSFKYRAKLGGTSGTQNYMGTRGGGRVYGGSSSGVIRDMGKGNFSVGTSWSGHSGRNLGLDSLINSPFSSNPDNLTGRIGSLAPDNSGMYGQLMQEGEQAFRRGEFARAMGLFRQASYIGGRRPEMLLSMSHAYFATASGTYHTPAYYLQQTIKALPELADARIDPSRFYGNASSYIESLIELENHVQEQPDDTDAWFLLAYCQWFGDRKQQAAESLQKALATAENVDRIEAIETFQFGMTHPRESARTEPLLFGKGDEASPRSNTGENSSD